MRKLTTLFLTATILVQVAACGHKPLPPLPPTPAIDSAKAEADLVAAHNAVRQQNGLPALVWNEALQKAAEQHSTDMATHGFMSHRGSDWSSPFTRINRQNYKWQAAGENIAEGQGDVLTVMKVWMSSPGHRANILGKQYRDVGVSVRVAKGGTPYWTVDFGYPQE